MTTLRIVELVSLGIFIFGLYVLCDRLFVSTNTNAFLDNWARRTLRLWLPFYALKRLIKEIFLKETK